jgi:hypothetical protein
MDQKQPEVEMIGVVGIRLEGKHSGKGKERERGERGEWVEGGSERMRVREMYKKVENRVLKEVRSGDNGTLYEEWQRGGLDNNSRSAQILSYL